MSIGNRPTRLVDWLAALVAREGADHAFGVPGGGSSLDLLDALRRHGVKTVLSAREDAAVIMAGVAGMLRGGPGVAFTTKGPGLASAANGIACAALDRLPALVVSEGFDPDELVYLSHQVFDQHRFAAPLLDPPEAHLLAPNAQAIAAWLAVPQACPRGPGVLLAGARELTAAVPAPTAHAAAPGAGVAVDANAVAAAAALTKSAQRPVVVLGLEASRLSDPAVVRDFCETLGAPVLSTYMAKGIVPDRHPLWAGLFTGGAIEQPCVSAADLIVTVGLDPVELIRKPWPYSARVLDIVERAHVPHYFEPAARLVGPLDQHLRELADSGRSSRWQPDQIAVHREHFLAGMTMPDGAGISATRVVEAAVDAFGTRPRLTVDAGAHMFSACALWPCAAPLDLLISNGLATMGFALPAALAAALHEPERGALAMTGDGGFMMCLGELKTLAQTGARVSVVVFNDARLSLIDIKREDRQMPDLQMTWKAPDFAAVAGGFGLPAWRVEALDELGPAMRAAARVHGPALVDVRVDSSGYQEQLRALRG